MSYLELFTQNIRIREEILIDGFLLETPSDVSSETTIVSLETPWLYVGDPHGLYIGDPHGFILETPMALNWKPPWLYI